jgi:hypothetical protein
MNSFSSTQYRSVTGTPDPVIVLTPCIAGLSHIQDCDNQHLRGMKQNLRDHVDILK